MSWKCFCGVPERSARLIILKHASEKEANFFIGEDGETRIKGEKI